MAECIYAYISKGVKEFSDQELLSILEKARINNPKDNITGMLLYSGGRFLQIIEGEETALDRLVNKIKADARHKNFYVLDQQLSTHRHFEDWSMGFKRTNHATLSSVIPGFTSYVEDPNDPSARKKIKDFGVQALIQSFKKIVGNDS